MENQVSSREIVYVKEGMTRFEKLSLWLMLFQFVAMLLIPVGVWKLLDPALEELKYKKEPVLAVTISTRLDHRRDYTFNISNIGKFPIDNVIRFFSALRVTIPSEHCDGQSVLENCVSTDPNVLVTIVPPQPGSLAQIKLSNPIQAGNFVDIVLQQVTTSRKLRPEEAGLTASVSSDSGTALARCVSFQSAELGGDDLSGGPSC